MVADAGWCNHDIQEDIMSLLRITCKLIMNLSSKQTNVFVFNNITL